MNFRPLCTWRKRSSVKVWVSCYQRRTRRKFYSNVRQRVSIITFGKKKSFWLQHGGKKEEKWKEKRKGIYRGAGIACWLQRRTLDRKVASLNPGRSGGRIFFSRVNFVCWLLFSVPPTPGLPQWHVQDPGHSAKSAGGKLHLNTYTPLTQRSRSGLTMALCRHSVGTYQETSSHATRHGALGHSRL